MREQVIGYQRKRLSDHQPIDMVALDMPERRFATEAVWFVPEQAARAAASCWDRCMPPSTP